MNLKEVFWKSKEIIPQINYIKELEENKFLAADDRLRYILISDGEELKIIEEAS